MRIKSLIIEFAARDKRGSRYLKKILLRNNLVSWSTRLYLGDLPYLDYAYLLSKAIHSAHILGYNKISVIEFGIAGGNGLLALETHVRELRKKVPIEVEIYGFDLGSGLPKSEGYRDVPYIWQKGFFAGNIDLLINKLTKTKIILGDVSKTVKSFLLDYKPAPIALIIFDLDYYSSTKNAMKLLKEESKNFLPRVYCLFDNVIGEEDELIGDFHGERLAIAEFNRENEQRKIDIPYALRTKNSHKFMQEIFILHFYDHPSYSQSIVTDRQLPLK